MNKLAGILAAEGLLPRVRVASTKRQLMDLILQGLARERDVELLVRAYVQEMEEEWVENSSEGQLPKWESTSEMERWYETTLGMIYDSRQAELAYQKVFIPVYLKYVPWANRQSALENADYPEGLPAKDIPSEVIQQVARRMGLQAAAEAKMLRDYALSRRGPE